MVVSYNLDTDPILTGGVNGVGVQLWESRNKEAMVSTGHEGMGGRQPVTGLHSDVGGSGSCARRPEGMTICWPRPTEIPQSDLKTAFFTALLTVFQGAAASTTWNGERRCRRNSGQPSSGATLFHDKHVRQKRTEKTPTPTVQFLLFPRCKFVKSQISIWLSHPPVSTTFPPAFLRFQHEAWAPLAKKG